MTATLQRYPTIDPSNAADFHPLLEARGYVWAPLVEPHLGYAGPEADFDCEVVHVGDTRTLVLAYHTPETAFLLGYQDDSDVPAIFAANEASVELALIWAGAL